jgi:hypothetical protein
MTLDIDHHDRNDDELPTTEEIIENLQDGDRCPVDDADRFEAVQGDIEVSHKASDGHVILRYALYMGWDMDCEFRGVEGEFISDEELQRMTIHDVSA